MNAQQNTEPGFHLRGALAILTAMSASPCRIIPPVPSKHEKLMHVQRMHCYLLLHLFVKFEHLCHQFKNFRLATRVSRDILEEMHHQCEPKTGLQVKRNKKKGCNVENELLGPKDKKKQNKRMQC
jgi:hypothetical protein